jgi:hypothetical protein
MSIHILVAPIPIQLFLPILGRLPAVEWPMWQSIVVGREEWAKNIEGGKNTDKGRAKLLKRWENLDVSISTLMTSGIL